MSSEIVAIIAIFIIYFTALIGIFWTKNPGFGKYVSSLVLLVLIIATISIFIVLGKITSDIYNYLISAIIGFLGGVYKNKKENES